MSIIHDSSYQHVTGKSEYVDDRPLLKNELYCEIILSTRAHAKIEKIHFQAALECEHCIAFFTGDDFVDNLWGPIFKDQPILASDITHFAGEPIGLLVGSDLTALQYAKKLIQVDYTDLPAVMNIKQARNEKSFIAESRFIKRGDVKKALQNAAFKLDGSITIQGADQFYLENQVSIAYPLEDGQMEIHASTQHPTEAQHLVAHALGLAQKDVVCIVKRMGGAFGGKESQSGPFAAMAALCALKCQAPVRLMLTKDEDMIITGKRNPFENIYQVAFDATGKIIALDIKLFSDAGAYADLSPAIMERAMLHCDNAYFIPHISVAGQVLKTNHHPHTAYRGFGGPKGVATIEIIIEKIAHRLGVDALTIRKLNMYSDVAARNITHYGQKFKNNCFEQLFSSLEKNCDYQKKRLQINNYNQADNQYLKGMSLSAVKFGISFTTRFLNQANAMVIIHQDGTLQISTGATEMGQGVNTKIAQLVTSELGLVISRARVMPTRTDKNANTSPTAASAGADLNGAAAILATRKIKYRLSQFAAKLLKINPDKWASLTAGLGSQLEISIDEQDAFLATDANFAADWPSGIATFFGIQFVSGEVFASCNPTRKISFEKLILEAYLNRINLSDYAHYKTPGIEFNKLTGEGDAFGYFTQGVACSEVSLNKDTGEVKVTAVHILMDLGRPLTTSLDKGQIAGAFIQGMGWVTSENLVYNEAGLLITHAPSTYKIPNIQDTPRSFKIDLIKNEENYASVRGSKAVGEPPLLLAISVWTAINNALSYLPKYKSLDQYPQLKIPAQSELVLRKNRKNC